MAAPVKIKSRTAKSIKNSSVALFFYAVNLILQFFSRKIFLDYLGTEVLGLNTTATNLLQFLNLAELGIGQAIACTLYKPLFEKDTNTINEIISLQGWMYRRIAWIVIGGSVLLMCFFPWIFAKMPLPLWYAYASFGVLLFSALLSYFINYKQIILSADQEEYKILYSYKTPMLIKVLCQIFAIKYFENGYIWWLVLEVLFSFIGAIALDRMVSKTYPFLKTELVTGRKLRRKYPEVTTKIKQLFFHKIGGFALTQASPIIIYAYSSLTLVALYGNYMLIITGVTALMAAMFNSMNAGVGNLVAEGNKKQITAVFEELFSIKFLVICTLCFGVYILTPSFITLWIGAEYIMDNTTLILMIAIMYINLSRTTVDAYINAYGLFSDLWAPVAEALINVGMSVLLGYFFGLHGILAGTLISLALIVFCWKPYFLLRWGLNEKLRRYVVMYVKHLVVLAGCLICSYLGLSYFSMHGVHGAFSLLLYGIVITALFGGMLGGVLYLAGCGLQQFAARFIKRIKR